MASARHAARLAGAIVLAAAAPSIGQLRVGTWNLTDYRGEPGRDEHFRVALFDEFEGRSFRPDVLVVQEMGSASAADRFLGILNSDARGGGDWVAAPYIDGPTTDTVLFYRASRASLRDTSVVSPGGAAPAHPRHLMRYDLAVFGYDEPRLVIYGTHMKAGTSSTDRDRRLAEALALRADARGLPAGTHFLLAGDLNMRGSDEFAYRELVESRASNNGRLFDPIVSPGTWRDSSLFRFLHTQDPVDAMDDRFDQILVNDDLIDGDGLDYLGDATKRISRTTFADPDHSFRTWGNDGTTLDEPMARDNAMVGRTIARALFLAPGGSLGHLPVFLDLRVPAKIGSLTSLDAGEIERGAAASVDLPVGNAGDVARWSAAGIQDLVYSFQADAPLQPPAGEFADPAGGTLDLQAIAIDSAALGPFDAELRILSNDPDEPVRVVRVVGEVVAADCPADIDGDGALTLFDFLAFQNLFDAGDPRADVDGDGALTLFDFLAFQNLFDAGC
ncbi:MAG: GC-type dockerin domain-anchored protein [Planctomycetota bacterium]